MAELRVVSSVINIVGFALVLSKKLYQFAATTSAAGEEIGYLTRNVTNFVDALEILAERLDSVDEPIYSVHTVEVVKTLHDKSCDLFDEIEELIPEPKNERSELKTAQQLTCYIRKERVNFLAGQIECLKTTASLVATVLSAGKKIQLERISHKLKHRTRPNPEELDRAWRRVTIAVIEHQQASNRLADLHEKTVAEECLSSQANNSGLAKTRDKVKPVTSIPWGHVDYALQSYRALGVDVDLVDHERMVIQESMDLLRYLVDRFTTVETREESHSAAWLQRGIPHVSTIPGLVQVDNPVVRQDPVTIASCPKSDPSIWRHRATYPNRKSDPNVQGHKDLPKDLTPDLEISSQPSDEAGQMSYFATRSDLKQTFPSSYDNSKRGRRPSGDLGLVNLPGRDFTCHTASFPNISPPDSPQEEYKGHPDEGLLTDEEKEIPRGWKHYTASPRDINPRPKLTGELSSGVRGHVRDLIPKNNLPPPRISVRDQCRKILLSNNYVTATAGASRDHEEHLQDNIILRMEWPFQSLSGRTSSAPKVEAVQINELRREQYASNTEIRDRKSRHERLTTYPARQYVYVDADSDSDNASVEFRYALPRSTKYSPPSQPSTETESEPRSPAEDEIHDDQDGWSSSATQGKSQQHLTAYDTLSSDDPEIYDDVNESQRHSRDIRNPLTSPRADPKTALCQVQALQKDFYTRWKRAYIRAMDAVPSNHRELRRLGENVMFHIIEAADAIDLDGDTVARAERRELLEDAQEVLERIDRVIRT